MAIHYSPGSSFTTSSAVRAYFSIGYFILWIIVATAGDRCCALRSKWRITRSLQTPVHHMTGWLSSFAVYLSWGSLHSIPGGSLMGSLMVLATLLGWAAILLVAILVRTVSLQSRCQFGIGMVVSTEFNPGQSVRSRVNFLGAPVSAALQAYDTSVANGGLPGVYQKVNRDLHFSASAEDVLGQWQCTLLPTELTFSFETSVQDIITEMSNANLTYSNGEEIIPCLGLYDINAENDQLGTHLVWAGSSAPNAVFTNFDVRVSFDTNGEVGESYSMLTAQCTINSSGVENLSGIMQSINSTATLNSWCLQFQGSIYNGLNTPASPNATTMVEKNLDAILMVAGGNDNILNNASATDTQGCYIPETSIDWSVIIVALVSVSLAIFLCMYWAYLASRIKSYRRSELKRAREKDRMNNGMIMSEGSGIEQDKIKATHRLIDDMVPGGIAGWMAQAVREADGARIFKEKRIKTRFFGAATTTTASARLGILHLDPERLRSLPAESIPLNNTNVNGHNNNGDYL